MPGPAVVNGTPVLLELVLRMKLCPVVITAIILLGFPYGVKIRRVF